jgi:hypothetical protein
LNSGACRAQVLTSATKATSAVTNTSARLNVLVAITSQPVASGRETNGKLTRAGRRGNLNIGTKSDVEGSGRDAVASLNADTHVAATGRKAQGRATYRNVIVAGLILNQGTCADGNVSCAPGYSKSRLQTHGNVVNGSTCSGGQGSFTESNV